MNGLTVNQYFAWKNEGLKDSEVLERLHYSPNSQMLLRNWKKKNGIGQTRKTAKLYTPKISDSINLEQVRELRDKGYKAYEIAKIIGVDYKYLQAVYLPKQIKNGNLKRIRRIGGQ